jgi:hypothetical protein
LHEKGKRGERKDKTGGERRKRIKREREEKKGRKEGGKDEEIEEGGKKNDITLELCYMYYPQINLQQMLFYKN